MKKIKFPSGRIGYELRYYMGVEDEKGHLLERPQIVQDMYKAGKCQPGKVAEYSQAEIAQLSSEVLNALDIKADHIDDDKGSGWTSLNQYSLAQFGRKLNQLSPAGEKTYVVEPRFNSMRQVIGFDIFINGKWEILITTVDNSDDAIKVAKAIYE